MARTSGPPILVVLLISAFLIHDSAAIGVNYGTLGNNLPPPSQVAAFLKEKTIIDRVKLFDANPDYLNAFANTGIAVTVTVANGDIPSLTNLPAAQAWVAAHISPFHPKTLINRIAVGNEILMSGDQNLINNLLPAMKTLRAALTQAGINNIQVSTPHSLAVLNPFELPSTGSFKPYEQSILIPILQFLRETKAPIMVNPYPYFQYSPKTLNYATFRPNPGVYDRFTRRTYTNLFDAELDATYMAMKRVGFGDIDIVVAETGWPSAGDQVGADVQSAMAYNVGVIRHVSSGSGTPLMPRRHFETYIFGLFNENQKTGPNAERNFGLFRPDFTPVYDAGVLRGAGQQTQQPRGGRHPQGGHHRNGPRANPHPNPHPNPGPKPRASVAAQVGKKWCVAKADASDATLQANLDWICSKGLDCKPVQAGGSCFNPNSIRAHASYAMNAYYQANGRHDFNCDFRNTGVVTTSNPSKGGCQFPA